MLGECAGQEITAIGVLVEQFPQKNLRFGRRTLAQRIDGQRQQFRTAGGRLLFDVCQQSGPLSPQAACVRAGALQGSRQLVALLVSLLGADSPVAEVASHPG